MEANVWLTSVALEKTDLGHVRQWRGKTFLIEHVVNVKTLNGSEHDGQSLKRWYGYYAFTGGREHLIFFYWNCDAAHTWHNFFSEKNSWF